MERRIEDHPFTRIERGSEVTIEFAGRAVRGFEGESVAMTLLADGITILSRSPKYQRPRGLFCGAGGCGNCLMRIDGMPNVRACRTPVHDGMKVEIQKSFPVAMPRVIETLFPHGIPYHTLFTHFRTINEAFLRITRRVAAAGRLPERWGEAVKHEEQREVDLLIVGGGGAGLAAAGAAAGVGASVLLVERDEAPGGYLRSASAPVTGSATGEERRKRGIELTRDLIAHAEAQGVEIMTDTTAVAFDPEGRIALVHPGGLTVVIPKRTIFTTGAYDLPLPFVNNDLPGIFTFHALQRIVNLAGILPGERILMIGSNSEVLHFACSLPRFGIRLGGIITESPALEGTMGEEFTESGVPIFVNRRIVRAVGREGVEGVEVTPTGGGGGERLSGDIVCVAARPAPAVELLQQAGCRIVLAEGRFVPTVTPYQETSRSGCYAAGAVCGTHSVKDALLEARIAALAALASLREDPAIAEARDRLFAERTAGEALPR